MKAGKLRHRITLIPPAITADAWGGKQVVPDAVPLGPNEVWAEVRPMSGKKSSANDGVQATTTYTITIRYRDDVTSSWRVAWNDTYLDLISVRNVDGINEKLELEAVESHG